jgi:uncharacterized protein (AIM24 family)
MAFENESARMLGIDVDGGVWLKPGAAVAYRGTIAFERRQAWAAQSVEDAVMRESAPLVRAVGRGRLYCGEHGAHVHVLRLAGESLCIAWPDLLAFEEGLAFAMHLVGGGVGIAAGGLVAVTLTGHGAAAVATHGAPLVLEITPDNPLRTDPHATLAWSAGLMPTLKTDLGWASVIGHGGHEPVQMHFEGNGVVLVQPYEDKGRFAVEVSPLKRLAAMVAG